MTNGAETSIFWNDSLSPPYASTNTSIADPPVLPQEHCDINQTNCGGPNVRRTADTEIKLATGGPLGSRQQNMWMISASATDVATGLPIPYDQISIGGFGHPDTNGNLVIMRPDNDPTDITVRAPGKTNYTFAAAAQGYKLLITCESPYPTNTHRLTIGVGELVDISLVPPLPYPYYLSNTWQTTAGSVSQWYGNTTTLTAPSNAIAASVTMNYYYKGVVTAQYISNFTVVAPTGVNHAQITSTTAQYISPTIAGAWMHLNVVIGPTNVSFYNVQVFEVGQAATNVQGYFTANWPGPHDSTDGANVWHPVSYDNLVDAAANFDICRYWGNVLPPPWPPGGSFTWPIPALWRVGTGPTNSLPWSDQNFSLGANGTMTITKYGQSVTRTINNVITPNL
ncbi:MAG: hypothetical protein ACLQU3_08895 [Limisphaerales bacterium]